MQETRINLGAGMTLPVGGGIGHVKRKWQIDAEHYFRKAGINVNTLNRLRLFRKMGLEVGTEQEYMDYRLSNGKLLSGKKQEKFIAGIVGSTNPNLMVDILVLKRVTTENGQNMLVDAILGWGEKYPQETMISITTIQKFASIGDSARLKIEEYLEKHGKEAAIDRLSNGFEDELLALKESALKAIAANKNLPPEGGSFRLDVGNQIHLPKLFFHGND